MRESHELNSEGAYSELTERRTILDTFRNYGHRVILPKPRIPLTFWKEEYYFESIKDGRSVPGCAGSVTSHFVNKNLLENRLDLPNMVFDKE